MLEFAVLIILLVAFLLLFQREQNKQDLFIDNYQYPDKIKKILKMTYPYLTNEDINIAIEGLKAYFKLYVIARRRIIVIPSRIIDRAWFEFMQSEEEYNKFCEKAFGFYLEQSPIGIMKNGKASNDLKIVWTLACDRENINPNIPNKLPLIFDLDLKLKINDGFLYTLNCLEKDKYYCAKDIGTLDLSVAKGGWGAGFGI